MTDIKPQLLEILYVSTGYCIKLYLPSSKVEAKNNLVTSVEYVEIAYDQAESLGLKKFWNMVVDHIQYKDDILHIYLEP